MLRALVLSTLVFTLVGCPAPAGPDGGSGGGAGGGNGTDAGAWDGGLGPWCDLPGSVVFAANGQRTVVPGGPAGPSLSWLSAPPGFCVHHFGNVPNARQVRIAPGGEVFVASPTSATTGGGPNGKAAILVLADDNHDGVADEPYPTFLASLPQTQGLLFANGFFYYQDGTRFRRLSYAPGQRQASGPGEQLVNVSAPNYVSLLHWPRSIDVADDGTLYFTNGSDQGEVCYATRPFVGGVLVIDGTPDGTPVMKGCRNPIGIRCQRGHGACYGVEMAMDYSEAQGGREKLFRVHAGDDQGYPCCATANRAYAGAVSMDSAGHPVGPPDCSQVTDEVVAFHIGRSPMGLDFEPGLWPAPWKKSVFVGLHGEFGTWTGAKVVAVATDPSTGAVRPASELAGGDASALSDFATGWDDGRRDQGRPDDVSMSADGRLFVTNDVTGEILWFAPVGLGPADGGP